MPTKLLIVSLVVVCLATFGIIYFANLSEAQTVPPSISGKFYKFDLVAQQGQNGIDFLSDLVSINDFGTVAFAAHPAANNNSVSQLFIRKINSQVTAITTPTLPDGTDRRNFGSVQINNSERV